MSGAAIQVKITQATVADFRRIETRTSSGKTAVDCSFQIKPCSPSPQPTRARGDGCEIISQRPQFTTTHARAGRRSIGANHTNSATPIWSNGPNTAPRLLGRNTPIAPTPIGPYLAQ